MGWWHHNCENKESKEGILAKGSGPLAKRVQKLKVLAKLQAVGVGKHREMEGGRLQGGLLAVVETAYPWERAKPNQNQRLLLKG
jgi:hypothetical protein